jgi:hypothetical protein
MREGLMEYRPPIAAVIYLHLTYFYHQMLVMWRKVVIIEANCGGFAGYDSPELADG